jgi:acyl-CoA synthetase (AMP-forming)/AMP-acid ligase II
MNWVRRPRETLGGLVTGTALLARAGLLDPVRPDVVPRALLALVRDGLSPAAAIGYSAARYPRELAIVDERGTLTFAEAAARVSMIAAGLRSGGVGSGDKIGLLCRNHSGMVLTTAALSSLGADVVLMNTSASPSEVAAVLKGQEIGVVIHDDELTERLDEAPDEISLLPVWRPGTSGDGVRRGATDRLPLLRRAPSRRSRFILLTSGTTGTPKGASRPVPLSLDPLLAILSRIPLHVRDTRLIASPLFHAWGFGNLALGFAMSSTLVLRERFDPEATLAAIAQHRVRVLAAVPVMLQRMVDLPAETRCRYDLSSLEVVASSGSAMPGELAERFMDEFGDVLYNIYGSTEAAWASIATPEDLRIDPRTAGRAPYGTTLRLVDDDGRDVPEGETARILVGNAMISASSEPEAGIPPGFVATGDLGHVDEHGLLMVDGREDDMIVSGGENIYPQEIEDVLASHAAVREVAVVGVDDAEFGQRLRAAVVLQAGESVGEDDLKEFVRGRLARFKVPREIVFMDELPRNATGKTLHRHLRDADAGA